MSFWTGEELTQRLVAEKLVDSFEGSRIDCAAYRLRIGRELYVTPSKKTKPKQRVKRILKEREGFEIPAGQFALLISEEIVRVPDDAVAFISIRATTKLNGLVNVSGFHVDPGFYGQLIFSVFNAGPGPIHLAQGEEHFLIWFADLKKPTGLGKKMKEPRTGISSTFINTLSGELHSLPAINERVDKIEKEQFRATLYFALALPIAIFAVTQLINFSTKIDHLSEREAKLEAQVASAASNARPGPEAGPAPHAAEPIRDAGSAAVTPSSRPLGSSGPTASDAGAQR